MNRYSFNSTVVCKSGGMSMSDRVYLTFDVHFVPALTGKQNGAVFYRSSQKTEDLAWASDMIRPNGSFNATHVFVATWERIRRLESDELNTFQIILVTYSFDSFLGYNYGECMSRPVPCQFTGLSSSFFQNLKCPNSTDTNLKGRYLFQVKIDQVKQFF
jgi:hypothetical protein